MWRLELFYCVSGKRTARNGFIEVNHALAIQAVVASEVEYRYLRTFQHIAGRCNFAPNNELEMQESQTSRKRRGFLDPAMVRSISFWITSACILVAVLASLLAIWQFAGTDILWRTVATCLVIGSGTVAFYWINVLFGKTSD